MALKGSVARQGLAPFQRHCMDDSGIGFDTASHGGKLRPACGVCHLVKVQPAGNPNQQGVRQRRTVGDQKKGGTDHFFKPVVPLDDALGRRAGVLLGASGGSDVIDAAVVLLAEHGDAIHTSDVGDLGPLAAAADLHVDIVPV